MSAEEGNAKGLSLEGLAQRLEALEQENAELRSKVATLEGSDTGRAVEEQEPASSSEKRRVSRSWLLRNAGAAAVGTMAAGALLARDASVAKANHFAPGISVDYVIAHLETAGLTAVFGDAPNGEGVVGSGKTNGVRGQGQTGVLGKTSATGFSGVSGQNTGSGYGVVGDGSGANFAGVLGRHSSGGTGVRGEGSPGVFGRSPLSGGAGVQGQGRTGVLGVGLAAGLGGVTGQHDFGYGVVGDGSGLDYAGVLGRHSSGGAGVRGEGSPGVLGQASKTGETGVSGRSTGSFGHGVVGEGGGTGSWAGVKGTNQIGPGVYGIGIPGVRAAAPDQQGNAGTFEGGRAQLRIIPKSGTGRPTSGTFGKGELYLDSAAALFVCVADGTPGTWRRFQTVAA